MPVHDVFICHASDDKEGFVRPLAHALRRLGVSVWYDEFSLKIGDSISRAIDEGIAGSMFGIIVISKAFIGRPWPEHELKGLVNRSVEDDMKLLPVWHGVTKPAVMKFSPSLSDKFAIDTHTVDAQEAAIRLLRIVRFDLYEAHPRADLERMASGEAIIAFQDEIENLRERMADFECPHCSSPLSGRTDAPVDESGKDWDVIETFGCGFETFAGSVRRPCPADPLYPTLDDYTLVVTKIGGEPRSAWRCEARPKTTMALKVRLDPEFGASEAAARRKVEAAYLYRARKISNSEWFRIQAAGGER